MSQQLARGVPAGKATTECHGWPPFAAPSVIRNNDWAWRRNQRLRNNHATLSGRPITLLPDRERRLGLRGSRKLLWSRATVAVVTPLNHNVAALHGDYSCSRACTWRSCSFFARGVGPGSDQIANGNERKRVLRVPRCSAEPIEAGRTLRRQSAPDDVWIYSYYYPVVAWGWV
jgi:hypothetical protein